MDERTGRHTDRQTATRQFDGQTYIRGKCVVKRKSLSTCTHIHRGVAIHVENMVNKNQRDMFNII